MWKTFDVCVIDIILLLRALLLSYCALTCFEMYCWWLCRQLSWAGFARRPEQHGPMLNIEWLASSPCQVGLTTGKVVERSRGSLQINKWYLFYHCFGLFCLQMFMFSLFVICFAFSILCYESLCLLWSCTFTFSTWPKFSCREANFPFYLTC